MPRKIPAATSQFCQLLREVVLVTHGGGCQGLRAVPVQAGGTVGLRAGLVH